MTTEVQQCPTDSISVDSPQDTLLSSTSRDGVLNELAMRIASVELTTPVQDILETRMMLSFMSEQVKELKARMDAALTEWIAANGPIEWGTKRLVLAEKKDTKCRGLRPALEALLQSVDGDWELFAKCLSSNALKYGACREVMKPEVWAEHFEVVKKTELKEGEAEATPIKELVELDSTFVKVKRSKA